MSKKKVYYRIKGDDRWWERSDDLYDKFKEVKVRKKWKCDKCGRTIKKGEVALVRQYTDDPYSSWASSWVRFNYCSECYEKKEEEN